MAIKGIFSIKNICIKMRINVFPLEDMRLFNYSVFSEKNEKKLFIKPLSLPNFIMSKMRKTASEVVKAIVEALGWD